MPLLGLVNWNAPAGICHRGLYPFGEHLTSKWRRTDINTSHPRPYDVITTSCACLDNELKRLSLSKFTLSWPANSSNQEDSWFDFFFQIEILCRLNDFSFSFLFSVGEQRGCRLYTVMLHNFRNSIPSHTSLPLSCSMLRKYIILISQCTIRLLTTKRPFFLGQTDTKTIHQFYIYPPSKNGRLIHCSFITLKQYYIHIELLEGW